MLQQQARRKRKFVIVNNAINKGISIKSASRFGPEERQTQSICPEISYSDIYAGESIGTVAKRKLQMSASQQSFGNSRRFTNPRVSSPGPSAYKPMDSYLQLSQSPSMSIPRTKSPRINSKMRSLRNRGGSIELGDDRQKNRFSGHFQPNRFVASIMRETEKQLHDAVYKDESRNSLDRYLKRSNSDARSYQGDEMIQADAFKQGNSKVKHEPKYSMPRMVYHSSFGLKPNQQPSIGPGAHSVNMRHYSKGSSVSISPSRLTGIRSSLNEIKTVKVESTVVGPGRYSMNLSSFPKIKQVQPSTFGNAQRTFKVTESVEVARKKKSLKPMASLHLSIDRYETKQHQGNPYSAAPVGTFSNMKQKKRLDFKLLGVEKTPGPASYLMPSDFGHMVEVTDSNQKTISGQKSKTRKHKRNTEKQQLLIGSFSGEQTPAEMTKLRNAQSQERKAKLEPLAQPRYNNGGRQFRVQKSLMVQQSSMLKKKSSRAKLPVQTHSGMQIIEEPHSFN